MGSSPRIQSAIYSVLTTHMPPLYYPIHLHYLKKLGCLFQNHPPMSLSFLPITTRDPHLINEGKQNKAEYGVIFVIIILGSLKKDCYTRISALISSDDDQYTIARAIVEGDQNISNDAQLTVFQ